MKLVCACRENRNAASRVAAIFVEAVSREAAARGGRGGNGVLPRQTTASTIQWWRSALNGGLAWLWRNARAGRAYRRRRWRALGIGEAKRGAGENAAARSVNDVSLGRIAVEAASRIVARIDRIEACR